ncbi:MAG: UvrB/UvrC motif-containing protein, partial [Gemmatimonadota bacterium]|nr:UvrB/UvrC motif-containing protein [Gemmatimonadota bacterium]
ARGRALMLCDYCKENDSVVTLTRPTPSGVVTVNVCEKCAAEHGFKVQQQPSHPLGAFLLEVQKQMPPVSGEIGRCPFCSATLRDFRTSGRLGCARCYKTFEVSLRDLLRRVHGASKHIGKRYVAPEPQPVEQASVRTELLDRLKRAVDAEQFELAAKLRDQIRVLGE